MWTTWMCRPVAVPAHPRILAGRRFLRISPNISGNISGDKGVAETAFTFKIHHSSVLVKEMSTMGAIFMKIAVF